VLSAFRRKSPEHLSCTVVLFNSLFALRCDSFRCENRHGRFAHNAFAGAKESCDEQAQESHIYNLLHRSFICNMLLAAASIGRVRVKYKL
jgi:hypothetical protein